MHTSDIFSSGRMNNLRLNLVYIYNSRSENNISSWKYQFGTRNIETRFWHERCFRLIYEAIDHFSKFPYPTPKKFQPEKVTSSFEVGEYDLSNLSKSNQNLPNCSYIVLQNDKLFLDLKKSKKIEKNGIISRFCKIDWKR